MIKTPVLPESSLITALNSRNAVSIVIITKDRPEFLKRCLSKLLPQVKTQDQVVIVDSSSTAESRKALEGLSVEIISLPGEKNNMPRARNLGIRHTDRELVAFLDDDSMVRPNWLDALVEPFERDSAVGGAGGRSINNGVVHWDGKEPIGRIFPNSKMTYIFDGDCGSVIEVDHFRGCNMAFRREALQAVGGFDESYTGTNLLEESDICVRIKRDGYKLVYTPFAVVDHMTAPRSGPTRFGLLYEFYEKRNSVRFFSRLFGPRTTIDYVNISIKSAVYAPLRGNVRSAARSTFAVTGIIVGFLSSGNIVSMRKEHLVPKYSFRPDAELRSGYTRPRLTRASIELFLYAINILRKVLNRWKRFNTYRRAWQWRLRFRLTGKRRHLGAGTQVHKSLRVLGAGKVRIGKKSDIHDTPFLAAVKSTSVIDIGDYAILNGTSIYAWDSVTIGENAILGSCSIVDNDGHNLEPELRRSTTTQPTAKPVVIGRNVWIGSGAMILKGVHIGDNSVVGAGTIVTKDVPSNVVVGGNPAKIVKEFHKSGG